MTPADTPPLALEVALEVGRALDAVGVGYFLGGSLASSLQGEPRATNDIDFVVDLDEPHVAPLSAALGSDFDVDEESLREAARTRGSWNIFHVPSAMKVDLFILRRSPFDDSEFARRQRIELYPGRSIAVKSAEDTVLRKLLWYRQGGEVSTTQWRDVVQVLRISAEALSRTYLTKWAQRLGLTDLLERAWREAGT